MSDPGFFQNLGIFPSIAILAWNGEMRRKQGKRWKSIQNSTMQSGSVKNCRHGARMTKQQEVRLKIGTSNKNSEKQINLKTGGGILGKKNTVIRV